MNFLVFFYSCIEINFFKLKMAHFLPLFLLSESLKLSLNTVRHVTFITFPEEYSEEEEKNMLTICEEIESQIPHLNSEYDTAALAAMSEEDRESVVQELVELFCAVTGLDDKTKSADVTTARKYLAQTKWEADLAVIAYFEELWVVHLYWYLTCFLM